MVRPSWAWEDCTGRGAAHPLPTEKPQVVWSASGPLGCPASGGAGDHAHGIRQESERRAYFQGKAAHLPGALEEVLVGYQRLLLPFPAAPRSWWNSPARAVQASATSLESTWGFSQATSQPWFKAFWSEWWTAPHPTSPCAWRPSARLVSPLRGPSAEVAPTSSPQPPNQLMGWAWA